IGVARITGALGVFKAYSTRVGEGPMPTETLDETGEKLRVRGHEFGTTTGRPRRCGWFDGVAGRYAARVNGLTTAALTLLDVLDEFDTVKLATSYETPAGRLTVMPAKISVLRSARPVYETLPGWRSPTSHCRQFSDLPAAARSFVQRLESVVGVRFSLISVGPDRDQTIVRDREAIEKLFI
ncbi:MAG: adenylosuccinate synthetase, partial [Acidobacteriota bacterium]